VYFSANAVQYPMLYVWVAVYACCFFSLRAAMVQLTLIAGAYGGVVIALGTPVDGWLLTAGTLAVVGVIVSGLRLRVRGLVAHLSDVAQTDSLTGLLNRRGFERAVGLELERARRTGRSLTLVVGDLDGFKHVNDREGHHAGDAALQQVAGVMGDSMRAIDLTARIGGEEFALVLPETDKHSAYVPVDRLRQKVQRAFASHTVPLTISFGIVGFPADGDSLDSLLRAADGALYAAKELGRNRSVIHSREAVQTVIDAGRERRAAEEAALSAVLALAEAVDARTAGNRKLVGRYAAATAHELGLGIETAERLRLAGLLHDVGKVAIPDAVLQKRGPLDADEWEAIRSHPRFAGLVLDTPTLTDVREWVLAHHERPDGHGYPRRLVAREIPLEAQILAAASAYEAMVSGRPYRPPVRREQACEELLRGAGTQFDERVVVALLRATGADSHDPRVPESPSAATR
jgi:diguanylate cyclase (GGDEF)-like protein